MRKILTAIIIVLTLFSSYPKPAHAAGSGDPFTYALSLILGGMVIPTIEFIGELVLPDPEPKMNPIVEVSVAEGKGAEENQVTAPSASVEGAGSPAVNPVSE